MWLCPVCKQSLHPVEGCFGCDNGHCHDLAKEGYLNLLLSHQRKSSNPGDNKEMIMARRQFLNQGHYQKLAEFVAAMIVQHSQENMCLLDIGCGEGYYTRYFADAVAIQNTLWIGGIDISKEAIKRAAKSYSDRVDFAVASNVQLPLADQSMSIVTEIFAPDYPQEISRVLKDDGLFIHVTPGAGHLYSLREMIYDTPQKHPPASMITTSLTVVEQHELAFDLHLAQNDDIANLLKMTPYYWQVNAQRQQKILSVSELNTEASFVITLYKKGDDNKSDALLL